MLCPVTRLAGQKALARPRCLSEMTAHAARRSTVTLTPNATTHCADRPALCRGTVPTTPMSFPADEPLARYGQTLEEAYGVDWVAAPVQATPRTTPFDSYNNTGQQQ